MPVETKDLLFSEIPLGPIVLKNRLVMAPMTRCRAGEAHVPTPSTAVYYAQRATAGLIVSEATQVSPLGVGYPNTPGIYSAEQVAGWKKVTDAVHHAGGRIYLQLWHVGRVSHSLWLNGERPVSSSAVAARGELYTPGGMKPYDTPRALDISEIPGLVEQYRRGAQNALAAGFDGVEVHGANGYLPDQFLRDGVNKRTDAYGGSVENRARFLLEIVDAVVGVWGKDRVGVRLSPSGSFNDMIDSNPEKTFSHVVQELEKRGVVYLHLIEGNEADVRHGGRIVPTSLFRPLFKRALIVCGDYSRERAEKVLSERGAHLVAFGRPFIANPDLPQRFAKNAPLNPPDPNTFYGGTEKGYTDYPKVA
jgi:N-ethylmaleimide reductase